jgi:hypothetical protein
VWNVIFGRGLEVGAVVVRGFGREIIRLLQASVTKPQKNWIKIKFA